MRFSGRTALRAAAGADGPFEDSAMFTCPKCGGIFPFYYKARWFKGLCLECDRVPGTIYVESMTPVISPLHHYPKQITEYAGKSCIHVVCN